MESIAAYYAAQRRNQEEITLLDSYVKAMKKEATANNLKSLLEVNFKFHETIVCASRNPFLETMTLQLRGVNSFYRKAILERNPGYAQDAVEDHERIFQAIVNQDQESARELMRLHIEHDYQSFMKMAAK
jgi:DNA-binding GntR family transcriptional regulator